MHIKCWLLLCSDMAIRSGTAARISPKHYDKGKGTLTFRTKYSNAQTLEVTAELRALLDTPGLDPDLPYVAQLARGKEWRTGRPLQCLGRMSHRSMHGAWRRLKEAAGVRKELRPHDLRRTTVRRVYELTHDLRKAQALLGHSDLTSTLWYLQAQHATVSAETLELAKAQTATELIQ